MVTKADHELLFNVHKLLVKLTPNDARSSSPKTVAGAEFRRIMSEFGQLIVYRARTKEDLMREDLER